MNFSEKFATFISTPDLSRNTSEMSDNQPKAQSKITSFFSKPVVQRTLTTSLVPDRKRKLDDTELEENGTIQVNKKQKIDKNITETTKAIDDANITRNTLQSSSKSSGKAEPSENDHSPKLNTKPMLSKCCNIHWPLLSVFDVAVIC
jgi:hypothetical protein